MAIMMHRGFYAVGKSGKKARGLVTFPSSHMVTCTLAGTSVRHSVYFVLYALLRHEFARKRRALIGGPIKSRSDFISHQTHLIR